MDAVWSLPVQDFGFLRSGCKRRATFVFAAAKEEADAIHGYAHGAPCFDKEEADCSGKDAGGQNDSF
jgi:hypothetical protein